jgi:hypothetical protein
MRSFDFRYKYEEKRTPFEEYKKMKSEFLIYHLYLIIY